MAYAIARSSRVFPRCDGISNFRAVVRKLWADDVVWTHQLTVSTLAGLPDQAVALQRLLATQDAIGRSVASFLGPANSLKLSKLLRDQIHLMGKVVAATRADSQKEWNLNAASIAILLNKANPRWPEKTLTAMLQRHLDLVVKGVEARLQRDWNGDIAAFDADFDHMMKFADFMSNGMLAMIEAVAARRR